MSHGSSLAQVTPLRVARREFTRGRLIAAAREVFFIKGYAGTKLEEIAQLAGTRRSTLYTHFRDKEEIIAAVTVEYAAALQKIFARVPAGRPSRDEIDRWIGELADFVVIERAPTELFVFFSHLADVPPPIEQFGNDVLDWLAERLPAFAQALEPGEDEALAWATATMRELGWALCYRARHGDTPYAQAKLAVACALFSRFAGGAAPAER